MEEMQHLTMFRLKEELVIKQVLIVYQHLLHGIDFQVYSRRLSMPACSKEHSRLLPTDLTGTKRVRANLLLLTQRCVFGFALTCIVFSGALCPHSNYCDHESSCLC